jgi:hypothetical protein
MFPPACVPEERFPAAPAMLLDVGLVKVIVKTDKQDNLHLNLQLDNTKVHLLACFHPETALFPNLGVNPHACVCGVDIYASVQALDFLDLGKNCSFPI